MLTESSLSVFQWVCVSFGRFIVGGRWPVPEPIPPDLLAVWFICSLLIRIGGKLPKHCFHSHMAFFGVLSSLRTWALIAANSSFARCLIDSQAVASINQKKKQNHQQEFRHASIQLTCCWAPGKIAPKTDSQSWAAVLRHVCHGRQSLPVFYSSYFFSIHSASVLARILHSLSYALLLWPSFG